MRKKPTEAEALPVKRATFAAEYLVDYKGGEIAAAAGFSKKTSHAVARRLLKKC